MDDEQKRQQATLTKETESSANAQATHTHEQNEPGKKQQLLHDELERLMRDERMEEGESWFLVAMQWWQQKIQMRGDGGSERNADEGEEDDAMDRASGGKDVADAGMENEGVVVNEGLVDIEFSSKKRKSVVLKPMLVCSFGCSYAVFFLSACCMC